MISIIVAMAENRVIGGGNSLLWHISEDLKRFKRITTGHPVIMGRKTFESMGSRPLPNRDNIVITRNESYRAEGCRIARSLDEAVDMFKDSEEVFIIGGGEIYRQAMPHADKLYITEVMRAYEGDTYFPAIDPSEWKLVSEQKHDRGEKFQYPFEYRDYVRILT